MGRAPGAVATPAPLADRLVAPLGSEPRVLDPACGDGELLLALLRARGGGPGALTGLSGLELSPERVRRARSRLQEASGAPAAAVARAVRQADALDPASGWPRGAAVAANPPWVSLSGRASRDLPREEKLRARVGAGWPSLHGAFLARIARHVCDAGRPARILMPASVCDLSGYGAVRLEVTRHAALRGGPVELGEDAFPGVTADAVLIELEPGPVSRRGSSAPWTPLAPQDAGLVGRLARFPRLGRECYGDPGVHTGNSAAALLAPEVGPDAPGVREGRDLRPFELGPPRRGLLVGLPRSPARTFRIGPLERYRAIPVLVRQTADRPIAALHTEPTYFRNTLLAVRPPPELDPAFVVAILNGPVAGAVHRLRFRDARQRTFPQVKVGHLGVQPFPIQRRDEDPALHDGLAALVRAYRPALGAEIEARALEAFGLGAEDEARVRALG